jgi:hypothetical protein
MKRGEGVRGERTAAQKCAGKGGAAGVLGARRSGAGAAGCVSGAAGPWLPGDAARGGTWLRRSGSWRAQAARLLPGVLPLQCVATTASCCHRGHSPASPRGVPSQRLALVWRGGELKRWQRAHNPAVVAHAGPLPWRFSNTPTGRCRGDQSVACCAFRALARCCATRAGLSSQSTLCKHARATLRAVVRACTCARVCDRHA